MALRRSNSRRQQREEEKRKRIETADTVANDLINEYWIGINRKDEHGAFKDERLRYIKEQLDANPDNEGHARLKVKDLLVHILSSMKETVQLEGGINNLGQMSLIEWYKNNATKLQEGHDHWGYINMHLKQKIIERIKSGQQGGKKRRKSRRRKGKKSRSRKNYRKKSTKRRKRRKNKKRRRTRRK